MGYFTQYINLEVDISVILNMDISKEPSPNINTKALFIKRLEKKKSLHRSFIDACMKAFQV